VDVSASGGVVTLTGEVESESVRQEALSIAQAAPGVQRVEDRLQVSRPAAPAGTGGDISPVPPPAPPAPDAPPLSPADMSTDEWITTQIQSRYFEDVLVKDAAIKVSASGGTVTLEGTVPNDAVKQQAVRIANETAGVSRVEDRLAIR
jgi:hyperosmotically inducible protein